MNDDRLYDYARGINAPYWIQEIKTRKGKRIWYFATPMQLSFFLVFILVFVFMVVALQPILNPINKLTHSISFCLYWFIPNKVARFYTEYEPQGKKMHIFIFDYLRYLIEFRLNNKAIYHEDRAEIIDDEEIVFEKINL